MAKGGNKGKKGKKGKKGAKGKKKDKGRKSTIGRKSIKTAKEPEIVPPLTNEEACAQNIRFTSYPRCQEVRCPQRYAANGCPEPDTSFTCLCPIARTQQPATPSTEDRTYFCDGTVLIFPRFC